MDKYRKLTKPELGELIEAKIFGLAKLHEIDRFNGRAQLKGRADKVKIAYGEIEGLETAYELLTEQQPVKESHDG